jgi:RNA polymerase sigma-70 factor (ECF subfamily)
MDWTASQPLAGGTSLDAQAVEAGRPGDFEAVYLAYAPMVRRTVWSLGRAEDLDDIVQDVFVKLWRHWAQFDGRSERRTWVYRITVNTARSHWRSRGRLKAALQRLWTALPRAQSTPPGQEAWDLDRGLARALAALDRRQREALTLVHLEGLSLAEAGQVMGVPEGTVKSRLFHARARMQALLSEDGHGKA